MNGEKGAGLMPEPLEPFGVAVESARPGGRVEEIDTSVWVDLVGRHRVVVARGFAPLEGDALPGFGRRFGEVLEWDFGQVNELRVDAGAGNYLYTNRGVPFHWDGAFVGRVPRYIIFQCEAAPDPGAGGETLFCDTRRLLGHATKHELETWARIKITYTTEKIVHYGGTFTSPLLATDPVSGEQVLRYAEPVEDLNPVGLGIEGLPEGARETFVREMRRKLNDPRVCYSHRWRDGDLLVADNYVLLHGRKPFDARARRHLRRVNVLGPGAAKI